MSSKKEKWLLLFCILNTLLVLLIGVYLYHGNYYRSNYQERSSMELTDSNLAFQRAGCYTLYIGTNDKDTYTPHYTIEEAQDMVNKICLNYVEGSTGMRAKGFWVDEKNNITSEDTLIYRFVDCTEEEIKKIMDEVIQKLNQNSILVEYDSISYEYYTE